MRLKTSEMRSTLINKLAVQNNTIIQLEISYITPNTATKLLKTYF